MLTGMELMSCPNLAVPAEVMHHIVHVESSANPFAIGVVGGQLMRQPQNLAEALATVKVLDAQGYNYSLGIAQVNRSNFAKYGLDTYTKAFDTCANLSAGAHILADCYARAKGDWGDAFSCYYSGNFKTGYRDGYVQKVYTSIEKESERTLEAHPIPLLAQGEKATLLTPAYPATVKQAPSDRAALRSVAVDIAAAAVVRSVAASASRAVPIHGVGTASASLFVGGRATAEAGAQATQADPQSSHTPGVFTPQVRMPNDTDQTSGVETSSVAANAPTAGAETGRASTQKDARDAAFVF